MLDSFFHFKFVNFGILDPNLDMLWKYIKASKLNTCDLSQVFEVIEENIQKIKIWATYFNKIPKFKQVLAYEPKKDMRFFWRV
jgi:hypothetical protein